MASRRVRRADSTWTRRATGRSPRNASTSLSASRATTPTGPSRSPSRRPASRPTSSPAASVGVGTIGSGTFRLEPPRLRTTEGEGSERHATWYELFFDLVFAAAVIELATALADDPTSAVFGRFAGLFLAIVWAWIGFAVYANASTPMT